MSIAALLMRIEILKNVIVLQDIDDISFQSAKLKKQLEFETTGDLTNEANGILNLIVNKEYTTAIAKINSLLNKYNTLTVWTDPEVQALKAEIIALSAEISALESELGEIDKTIHLFEVKQIEILGDIILEILDLKRKIAAKKVKENPKDSEAKAEYQECETDERDYKGIYEDAVNNPVNKLTPEEEQEIKSLFRKIVKLTHPDLVDKIFEKQAAALFDKAKRAKDNNDLNSLKEIFAYLINDTPFSLKEETITEKETLKNEITHLRAVVIQLKQRLNEIQSSDAYKAIISIPVWDAYFMDTKGKLLKELDHLKLLQDESA